MLHVSLHSNNSHNLQLQYPIQTVVDHYDHKGSVLSEVYYISMYSYMQTPAAKQWRNLCFT